MNVNHQMNKNYNVKRIYRLMKDELNISSIIRRKKKKYIKTSAEYQSENILNRNFSGGKSSTKSIN